MVASMRPRQVVVLLLHCGLRIAAVHHNHSTKVLTDAQTCPGAINISGYGSIEMVATKWNMKGDPAAKVSVANGQVVPHLKGRAYFGESCKHGVFSNENYVAMKLLGKTLAFTTDLSQLGCGCNAAFYLTNLRQNTNASTCEDYYCDANAVCGVRCAEMDIMEANSVAFHATPHTADDGSGVAEGYGGGGDEWSGPRQWSPEEYGPEAKCINTMLPFQVAASFPVFEQRGTLAAMVVTLSQGSCNLSVAISTYQLNRGGKDVSVMDEVTQALAEGMTPIVSFWQADDMLWLDGKGLDGKGPCVKDLEKPCPANVSMHSFLLEPTASWPEPSSGNSVFYIVVVVVALSAIGGAAVYCVKCGSRNEHGLLSGSE